MIANANAVEQLDTGFVQRLDAMSKLVKTGRDDLVYTWGCVEPNVIGLGMSNLNLAVIKYATNISDGSSVMRGFPGNMDSFAIGINDLHGAIKAAEPDDGFMMLKYANEYSSFATGIAITDKEKRVKYTTSIDLNNTRTGMGAVNLLMNLSRVAVAYSEDCSTREDFMSAVSAKSDRGLKFISIGHNTIPVWSGLATINKGDSCSIGIKYVENCFGSMDTYAFYTVTKPKKNVKVTSIVKILHK